MSDDGGPAFPTLHPTLEWMPTGAETIQHPERAKWKAKPIPPGMSLRVYAAIRLRVPDSGIDWLDEMIRQAKRNDFAGQAMAGLLTADKRTLGSWLGKGPWSLAAAALAVADAMLAEKRKETP